MKPNDLYAMEPESTTYELHSLESDHLPELGNDWYPHEWWSNCPNTRVQVKVIKNHSFDGERIWKLQTVWFDDKPFMITQNAGRSGRDHDNRFITNAEVFKEAVYYIRSLFPELEMTENAIDPNEDIYNLVTFYNHTLAPKMEKW